MKIQMRTIKLAAFLLTSVLSAGRAHATTVDSAYRADWCRFAAWATCAATGECKTPSQVNDNGWTLDGEKLQPKSQQPTGYPVEFVCPLIRVFKSGANSTQTPPLNVQLGVAVVPGKNVDCTLYSLTKYGAVKQQTSFSLSSSTSSQQQLVKTLKLTQTDADGSFSLSCKLPNTAPNDSTAGTIYSYRSEETSTSTDVKWRTYPSSRCAVEGAGKATKLRYFFNKATNVDTANRTVSCPAQDIEQVAGTTPKYTATVYINEANAAGGSKCRLVGRWHFDSTIKQSTPYLTTSAAGDKTLPLAILPADNSDYTLRYTVDCTLTPGSSIYSYVMGHS